MNDDWAFTQKTCFQDFYLNGATRIYTINSWVLYNMASWSPMSIFTDLYLDATVERSSESEGMSKSLWYGWFSLSKWGM